MIEITIYDYLNSVLSVPAYMEMPKDPPQSFILLEKTSGGMENYLSDTALAVQSYADTLYHAAVLNDEVKEAMLGAVILDEIISVRLNSDYNYTDGTTKTYRYQAVFDIKHY